MELVVTKVERGVDGLERFEVNVNLSLFPFRGDDFTTVDDETVGRDFVVELETLLGGGNGRQHRQTVDPGFDVRSGTLCTYVNVVDPVFPGALSYVFFSQHLRGAGNLIFGSWMLLVLTFLAEPARRSGKHTNDQRNHGGSVSSGGFEPLNELLNLPYFNILFRLVGLRCAHGGQRDATEVRRP